MAVFVVLYIVNGMSAPHIHPDFRIDLSGWGFLIDVGTAAIPGLFMLYCFQVFQESRHFPLLLSILFGVQLLVEATFSLFDPLSNLQGNESAIETLGLMFTSMDLLQLVFAGAAVYWTINGWRADLVEDRRAWRWVVIGIQGGLIFTVVLVENFLLPFGSMNDGQAQAVIVYVIALLALGMVVITMQVNYLSLSKVIRKVAELTEEPAVEVVTTFDKDGFHQAFKEGKLYREAGLTIASLARKLSIPEYRLRAFIHKTLGFRNFNAMLHKYRIEDACDALADPRNQNVPVLTIALTVGYQSITPFNNAFREIVGVTPSEFRKQKING
ncbi:MAG: helix-turn-helix domain-containing protein, partial [Pseudohongiellaceae bacterium]